MRDYQSIREEWMHLRKIPKTDKLVIDYKKQNVLEMVVDKVLKAAKDKKSEDFDSFVQAAVKSELKQFEDAHSQGVDCQTEIDILSALMPDTLSEEEISGTVIAIIARYENPNMGLVMKDLKEIEGIDMKIASKYVKELL